MLRIFTMFQLYKLNDTLTGNDLKMEPYHPTITVYLQYILMWSKIKIKKVLPENQTQLIRENRESDMVNF